MKTTYAKHVSAKVTPQTEPIPGKQQVQNSAGGFAFQIGDFERLDRFLILGCEGGTYYAGEQKLTRENADCVLRCAAQDFNRTVNRIVEISKAGRAPKNDPAIFALALIAGLGEPAARTCALDAMPRVCRIGTHLFQFVQAVKEFRGFGRGLRTGIGRWYTSRTPDELAYQVVKYQQRGGMSHRDVLRMCHVKANESVFRYLTGAGLDERTVTRRQCTSTYRRTEHGLPTIIHGFERAKQATDVREIVRVIRQYNLPRECIPTQFLNDPAVWEALLVQMPLTAMIRNLGKMSAIDLLKPLSESANQVVTALENQDNLLRSRVHPIAILAALLTYSQGHGERGKLSWTPQSRIIDALNDAFYASFGNVVPTGKRWMLACDISGSMEGGTIAGIPGLTPRVAAAAMALVTAAVEKQHYIIGFTDGHGRRGRHDDNGVTPIDISPKLRLETVCKRMAALPMGSTDCALPILHAIEQDLEVDAVVILTDNESYAGDIHVCQALEQYRQKTGIDMKVIACAMTATEYSVADPANPRMLDVVGFDTATPQLMADFVRD